MTQQWQTYKKLELIPDSTQLPQTSASPIVRHLSSFWQFMVDSKARVRLSHDQQVSRLNQCYELELQAQSLTLGQHFWWLLNQPLWNFDFGFYPEPQVWKSTDRLGHLWWHVYDPMTGQKAHLESEEEVQIWLEEHLR